MSKRVAEMDARGGVTALSEELGIEAEKFCWLIDAPDDGKF